MPMWRRGENSMTTKGKHRTAKKRRPQKRTGKTSDAKVRAAFKSGRQSVVVPHHGTYKVYGGKTGRVAPIGSRSTAKGIAGRIGAKPHVFREVGRLIDSLRS